VWLAPVQVRVLPITDRHIDYVREVVSRLDGEDIRVELDDRNEKVNYKIREAQGQKIPYMLVVGDREAESGSVAVRQRSEGDLGTMSAEDFSNRIKEDIKSKKI